MRRPGFFTLLLFVVALYWRGLDGSSISSSSVSSLTECTECNPSVIVVSVSTTGTPNCCDPLCAQCLGRGPPPIVGGLCTGNHCPCRNCVCCYTSTVYIPTTTTCVENTTEFHLSISTWTVSTFENTLVTTTINFTFTQFDTVIYTITNIIGTTTSSTSTFTTGTTLTVTSVSTFYLTSITTSVTSTIESTQVTASGILTSFASVTIIDVITDSQALSLSFTLLTFTGTIFTSTPFPTTSFIESTTRSLSLTEIDTTFVGTSTPLTETVTLSLSDYVSTVTPILSISTTAFTSKTVATVTVTESLMELNVLTSTSDVFPFFTSFTAINGPSLLQSRTTTLRTITATISVAPP